MNASAAVAVYDSGQTWGGPDRGIQLFGRAKQACRRDLPHVQELYRRCFPAYDPTGLDGYRYYRFRTQRLKLFDENTLGPGVFVTATVLNRRELTYEGTEISHR